MEQSLLIGEEVELRNDSDGSITDTDSDSSDTDTDSDNNTIISTNNDSADDM